MKQGMSVFQIVLLSVFGVAAVVAVLVFAFLVSSGSQSSVGTVTVWGTFDETAFSAVLRPLSDADGRLKGVTYVQKTPEAFDTELTNALASGTGPDLYIMRSDHTVVDAPKVQTIPIESISKEQFQDLFVEGANVFMTSAGAIAIPFAVDPYVMYWNRDMFSTGGLAKPPVFWDELFEVARAVTKKTDAGSIVKSGIAFGEYVNVSFAKGIVAMLMMQAGSPITVRDNADRITPAMVTRSGLDTGQAAESALMFYTNFADPTKDYYSWNRAMKDSRTAFADADLALYFGLASEEPVIRALNPNLNFAPAPMPQIRNAERAVNGGVVYAFAIPKTSKNPSGAFTVAYLLATPEASKIFAQAFGIVSARREVLAQAGQGTFDLYQKQALNVRSWEDPHPKETNEIFRAMIESVTSGSAKLTEAILRAEQAMRQLLPL